MIDGIDGAVGRVQSYELPPEIPQVEVPVVPEPLLEIADGVDAHAAPPDGTPNITGESVHATSSPLSVIPREVQSLIDAMVARGEDPLVIADTAARAVGEYSKTLPTAVRNNYDHEGISQVAYLAGAEAYIRAVETKGPSITKEDARAQHFKMYVAAYATDGRDLNAQTPDMAKARAELNNDFEMSWRHSAEFAAAERALTGNPQAGYDTSTPWIHCLAQQADYANVRMGNTPGVDPGPRPAISDWVSLTMDDILQIATLGYPSYLATSIASQRIASREAEHDQAA